MARNNMASTAWKAMVFIQRLSKTTSQPEMRAALVIAGAGMLALLREIARQESGQDGAALEFVENGRV
jgi:hypothetical protein